MSQKNDLRILHIFVILGMISSFLFLSLTAWIVSFLIAYLLSVLAQPIAMHRYFTHRSFKTYWIVDRTLAVLATLCGSGSVLIWINVHRLHHRHSDTYSDPHSPSLKGKLNVFFASWFSYHYPDIRNISEAHTDSFLKFLHDYYMPIHILYILLLTLINPLLLFPFYIMFNFITLTMAGAVNTFCHIDGEAGDVGWLKWLAAGEGWHNYHHTSPMSAINPSPDLSGAFINIIRTD